MLLAVGVLVSVCARQDGNTDWLEFLRFFEMHFDGVAEAERIEEIRYVSLQLQFTD